MAVIRVKKDGSGDYKKIHDAIISSKEHDVILVGVGVFNEKIDLTKSNITIIGSGINRTKITYDDYGYKKHADGRNYGTFRSYTMLISGDNIILRDLSIENNAGDGSIVGQAIALYVDGDCVEIRSCRIIGRQDTLFCGPLPPSPRIPNSFVGPGENKPYKQSKQYYKKCEIFGDIDFIFGSGLAVFDNCKIYSLNSGKLINGYVTAASTWKHEPYGFIFIKCQFLGEDGINNSSVYLGRPWRGYAKVYFEYCSFAFHIHENHVDTWGDSSNKETTSYKENSCNYFNHIIPDDDGVFLIISNTVLDISYLFEWHQMKLT